MSKVFQCLPSEILNIDDEYTAYCFNEACCNLILRIQGGEEPHYKKEKKIKLNEEEKPKEYKNMKDFYDSLDL